MKVLIEMVALHPNTVACLVFQIVLHHQNVGYKTLRLASIAVLMH